LAGVLIKSKNAMVQAAIAEKCPLAVYAANQSQPLARSSPDTTAPRSSFRGLLRRQQAALVHRPHVFPVEHRHTARESHARKSA
jgi:hypothetical protein